MQNRNNVCVPGTLTVALATMLGAGPAQALPEEADFPPLDDVVAREPAAAPVKVPLQDPASSDEHSAQRQADLPGVSAKRKAEPMSDAAAVSDTDPPSDPAPASSPPPPPPPPAPAPAPPPAPEPLAGISDGAAFLRSPDNFFQLFPGGRLQVDSYYYKGQAKTPNNTVALKRARAELSGWVGPMFFFSIAGDFAAGPPPAADPVAPANLNTTDNFAALAPWGNRVIFQAGQFDAPFTLENRTSDKYFDFLERAVAVRAFGIPSNKEQGLMVHGMLPSDSAYYSVGVFNGDGQNFRNADTNFDVMGRGWLSLLPIALQPTITMRAGGSFWVGKRENGLPIASQSTEAGFAFWSPKWTGAAGVPLELHQDGDLRAYAAELDVSVWHKMGLRVEWVYRKQPLSVADISKAGSLTLLGTGSLSGNGGYAEIWYWPIGDNLIIGEPGLQFPSRWKKMNLAAPRHGLMLAARLERLSEQTSEAHAVASPARGSTKLWGVTAGLNYWWSKRVRASVNYGLNSLSGSAAAITALPSGRVQELLLRIAFAL